MQTKIWLSSKPEKQGINSSLLNGINEYIANKLPDTSSILIVRNGYIVFEHYYKGNKDDLRPIYSINKAITSALIGIAISKGLVKSTDEEIFTYLPDSIRGEMNIDAKDITIRNLLTMTSGFSDDGGEGTLEPSSLRLLLSMKPVYAPGEVFAYNGSSANLLSAIITQTSGIRASKFANKYLFEPLGIKEPKWNEGTQYSNAAYGLSLSTRDMAKIGQLFLKRGKWGNRQLIPEEWIELSTKQQVDVKEHYLNPGKTRNFGYLWWTMTFDSHSAYYALGYQGQYICVIPDLSLVVVMTGTGPAGFIDRMPIIRDFVIRSCTTM